MSLDKFIRLSDRLVEFEASLNDKQPSPLSHFILETHKEEIKDIWNRLKLIYEQCLVEMELEAGQEGDDEEKSSKENESKASEIETVKSKFKSAYATYCRCISHLGELLQEISPPISHTVPTTQHGFKLPPCEIPIFSGDYPSWPTFRDMFTAVCIKNPRLSSVEKLFHLSQRTKGEPNDIVKKIPLTNENFTIAWKNLCSRYENKRVLVNIQLKTLFTLQNISSESGSALKSLQRDINSCISLLKLYGVNVDTWDPIFIHVCSNRLPEVTLTLWEQTLSDKSVIPRWSELDSFLTSRHRTLESVSEIRRKEIHSSTSSPKHLTTKNNTRNVRTFHNNISNNKCRLCPNESHVIRKCPKFLLLSPNQRYAEIKKSNLCLNCFSMVHTLKNCTSKFSCYKCNKRHNTLLHRDPETSKQQPPTNIPFDSNSSSSPPTPGSYIQSSNSTGGVIKTCFSSQSNGVLLGTAIVKVIHNGTVYVARALIDSGSEGSFISEKLFHRINLPYKRTCAKISGLNNTISAAVQKECSFLLRSTLNDNLEISVSALVVPHLSGSLPSRTVDQNSLENIPDIPLADPQFYQSSNIDILIGGDIFPFIMLTGIKRHVCGSLIAQETIFGWILTGPISIEPNSHCSAIVSYFCEVTLDKQIARFWEVEDIPRKTFLSPSEQYCENLYNKTTRRNENGRYIVSLPFKDHPIDIGQSRNSALAQFYRNEARLLRNSELKKVYDNVLEEYKSLKHMSPVSPFSSSSPENHYYLPHHAVIKPESTTTKVRVVFNASSPSSTGRSLNDFLHTGPVLQNDLVVLILKWRFFRYVFNGDITKMYRQILVNPEHTPFQRILHRCSPSDSIQDFELQTVTFGVNCAPFLAIRTILQLADDVKISHPLASDVLRNSMYVDDALIGAHSLPTAIETKNQLVSALSSAGFSMRKWTSNSKQILSDLPSDQLLFEDFLELDDRSTAKTLGIRWNASSDSFFFSATPFPDSSTFTKREVLSQIAKLFDPAGWLAPFIIIAKTIMQDIWTDGTKWDEVISSESLSKWKSFQSAYSFINDMKIPRWVGYSPKCEIQFHGFSDASEKAYAAAIYVRVKTNNSVFTYLLCSKSRVAPIKTLSIPKLELCGAVLLAEMMDNIVPNLRIENYSIFCWTDSTIVLSWLAKPPCFWTTFVANRVSKVIQVINPTHWNHVRSESNPADLASRGALPQELLSDKLWWEGPTWLKKNIENWPRLETKLHITDIERKPMKVHFSYYTKFEDILDRFSSFSRAVRVVAYIYRFLHHTHIRFRSCFRKESHIISVSEIVAVQYKLITMSQKAYYPEEYMALSIKQQIPSSSSILNLNPFLDGEGVMRICGRLVSSPGLSYDEKHPVILPYSCQYSRLLVKFIHDITLHGGNQLILRLTRLQYWIIKVKNLIKCIINNCKPCTLYKRRCQTQLMSSLPPKRTEISRPFTHTGLDFTGPFDIKSYAGRSCKITKGYVCVFVCFSTKAIHLEVTSDLSTSTFLAAFSRFVSRRGCPQQLHSDNGTNFVGASKVLASNFIKTAQEAIESNYGIRNVMWHFIPPGAPHMGGLWEAGVKSFKSHFRKVVGNFKYTFEEFQTLVSKIEACLNSRPLSPISQDPSDLSALTPGHFLIGSPILAPIDPNIEEAPISLINRWQRLQALHQRFCTRWKDEYLKELHKRHKWKHPSENLKENMIVVIKDENLPPNSWRLGRISKLFPGSDGRVRVAEVYTEKGTITRPITKLVVLPTETTSFQALRE